MLVHGGAGLFFFLFGFVFVFFLRHIVLGHGGVQADVLTNLLVFLGGDDVVGYPLVKVSVQDAFGIFLDVVVIFLFAVAADAENGLGLLVGIEQILGIEEVTRRIRKIVNPVGVVYIGHDGLELGDGFFILHHKAFALIERVEDELVLRTADQHQRQEG